MSRRIAVMATTALVALAARAPAQSLGIGDPAPALNVKMVRGEPIASALGGKVHVIEFWATWCSACKKSIPHVTELQKKFPAARFVGVSIFENDQADVAPFVADMGERMGYDVAMDVVPEGKDATAGAMTQSWMKGADKNGIPFVFIVDASGKIAWMGAPSEMDRPLESVLAGTWDIGAAAARRKDALARSAKVKAANAKIQSATQAQDWKTVLALADELIALDPVLESKGVAQVKFQALLSSKSFEPAFAYGRKVVDGACKDDSNTLNSIAWLMVDPAAKPEKRDLELALKAALRASELTKGEDPAILDTVASVYFEQGNLPKAIEVQEKAAKLSVGTKFETELHGRLEQFKKAAQSQKT